jgi:Ca-activated chloride channel family protein
MAGRKKTSRINTILIIIAVIFVYNWVFDDDSTQQSGQAGSGSSSPVPPAQSYARSFARSWPSLDANTETSIAEQLVVSNYYVILDGSGSMEEQKCSGNRSKMAAAKDAMLAFAEQFPATANLGLAVFDGNSLSQRVALGAVDADAITKEVLKTQPNGGTPLLNAITLGYQALEAQARRQLGYGEYHLVVLTDGEANSGQDPTPAVNRILSESPVVIHTIGFCIGKRHSLNQPGRIDYRAADDLDSLKQGLAAVLAESPDFIVTDF